MRLIERIKEVIVVVAAAAFVIVVALIILFPRMAHKNVAMDELCPTVTNKIIHFSRDNSIDSRNFSSSQMCHKTGEDNNRQRGQRLRMRVFVSIKMENGASCPDQ